MSRTQQSAPIVAILIAACGLALIARGSSDPTSVVRGSPNTATTADPDSARFEKDIADFETWDRQNSFPRDAVLFVGSSSIRMWDLKKSFPDKKYLNRGFGGSQICHSTHFFDVLVAKHKPRLVVLYAGDNDIAGGKSPEQVHQDFRAFAKQFTEELPDAKLVYIAIKPSIARWKLADKMREANKLIAAECEKDEHFAFADVWPAMLNDKGEPREDLFLGDGLHMNEKGYAEWVKLVGPLLD